MGSEAPELQMEVFHDMILTNETEIFEQIYQSQHVVELDKIIPGERRKVVPQKGKTNNQSSHSAFPKWSRFGSIRVNRVATANSSESEQSGEEFTYKKIDWAICLSWRPVDQ